MVNNVSNRWDLLGLCPPGEVEILGQCFPKDQVYTVTATRLYPGEPSENQLQNHALQEGGGGGRPRPATPTPSGGDSPTNDDDANPNKSDCEKLRARLAQAQQIAATNAARILPGGIYSSGIALSADDATSLTAGIVGALASGAVKYYEARPVVNGPNNMQYLTNGVNAAKNFRAIGYVAGGIALVVDGKMVITAENSTDRGLAAANLATDLFLLGGSRAIPALGFGLAPAWLGPWGLGLAGAQFGINFGTAIKLNADANDILRANASAAQINADRANATAADIQKQMLEMGCTQ